MQNNAQRETVIYKPDMIKGLPSRQYEKDLKRRQKDDWQLVSCTENGPLLTAIYERTATPGPAFDLPNLSLLLSTLSLQERASFESEVQTVINRWLAMKATQQ